MNRNEALILLQSNKKLTQKQIDQIREALRNQEASESEWEDSESEWSDSGCEWASSSC